MMGQRRILGCLILLSGLLTLLLFNKHYDYTELVFSQESGFYDEPFILELHAPIGTEIYYTLDGSEPDENALLYTEPILIEDATPHENVYCMRTDVSTGFLKDEMITYGFTEPDYILPDYPIDKCTIVKAAYRDMEHNFSDIKTESYFVGYKDKAAYNDLNVISIATDPDHLFDYNEGIYVLGENFYSYPKEENPNAWWHTSANYCQRGREWERPASIQLFDTEKNILLKQNCGLRIQGGWSRRFTPKSLNLYAQDPSGENSLFYRDLFHTGYLADAVTLTAGGNDYISKLRDMLMCRLVEDRAFATMNYEPYAVFLNGEYWGFYWLTEKYDDVFLSHSYEIDADNIIMVKQGELSEGEESDLEQYTKLMDFLENNNLTLQKNYDQVSDLIDLQSFIDYYTAEIYIGRWADWPYLNEALWRTREAGNGTFADNKWRWMLFDVNLYALTSELIDADTMSITMERSYFNNLCQNDDFKKQFTITFMDLANTTFSSENVNSIISEYLQLMEEPIKVHMKRFFGSDDISQFRAEVADIRDFFDHRRPYIVQYLKDDLNLAGSLAPVTLEINDPAAGSIILNTVHLSFEDAKTWHGEYYTDYPITITAVANDGYRFVRWENAVSSQNDSIEVNLDESGICIKAIFENDEDS